MRKKKAFLSGMPLTSRLSIIVAAESIGVQQELITSDVKGAIFPLVLPTCLLDPTVFKPTAKGEVESTWGNSRGFGGISFRAFGCRASGFYSVPGLKRARRAMGSTRLPRMRTPQWRWGPVARPVSPAFPISCP